MTDEHQAAAVRALELLSSICQKHGIGYLLIAGTCLGAVRHKGMIPWDDDIDVGFTYNDWYRIRRILPKELTEGYEYLDYEVREGFPRLFGKILYQHESCIDIFLIAKWTSNRLLGKIHWEITRFSTQFYIYSTGYVQNIRANQSSDEKRKTQITHAVRRFLFQLFDLFCDSSDYIRVAKWNEDYFGRHKYDCYINLYSVYSMRKEMLKKEWVERTSIVSFEDEEYLTVGDTDAYLRHLYGDYMKLPPEEKRKRLHAETFY